MLALLLVMVMQPSRGFQQTSRRRRRRVPIISASALPQDPPKCPVRFINTPQGRDLVTEANVGDLLLDVADSVGIHIPRGCKSGLCGSCTCDLKDPEWSAAAQSETSTTGQAGFQMVRACSTKVMLFAQQQEFVVDLFRMRDQQANGEEIKDPMARFSGDWETEFVPDYKSNLDNAPVEREVFDPESFEKTFGADGVAPWDMVCDPLQRRAAPPSPRPRTQTMSQTPQQRSPPPRQVRQEARMSRAARQAIEEDGARAATAAASSGDAQTNRGIRTAQAAPVAPTQPSSPVEEEDGTESTFGSNGLAPWDMVW